MLYFDEHWDEVNFLKYISLVSIYVMTCSCSFDWVLLKCHEIILNTVPEILVFDHYRFLLMRRG